jgi:S1-C subfamily serine protease
MQSVRAMTSTARGIATCLFLPTLLFAGSARSDNVVATIDRVKGSVVAIGTYERTRTPPFQFKGTGFAVGDGTIIVTNSHVLSGALDPKNLETLAILLPAPGKDQVQVREAKRLSVDTDSDLALLKIERPALPALKLRDSDTVREGDQVLFTGFPIGPILGAHPATHRGMVAAISPIAIPQARSAELDSQVIRRIASGAYPIFQLDATAYPGNSGSPLYDPESGEVVGIINMVWVKGTKESALSQPSGITYAVPSKHLKELLEKAR